MGNKAAYRNLAEDSQRRGIKRHHLLNCSAYRTEAARPKVGSSKGKQIAWRKKKNLSKGREGVVLRNLPTKWHCSP